MRVQILNSIYRLVHKAFRMGKAAKVTYVEDDMVFDLAVIEWTDIHRHTEGIQIGSFGMMDGERRTWLFETAELAEKGITRFKPHGFFWKDTERWDFVKNYPITANVGPQAENNPIVYIYVRRSVEANSNISGDEFGFDLTQ